MSLKAFHIFFVIVSTLMSGFVGVWALRQALHTSDGAGFFVLGVGALLAAVALPIYGVWFLKKMKDVSYL